MAAVRINGLDRGPAHRRRATGVLPRQAGLPVEPHARDIIGLSPAARRQRAHQQSSEHHRLHRRSGPAPASRCTTTSASRDRGGWRGRGRPRCSTRPGSRGDPAQRYSAMATAPRFTDPDGRTVETQGHRRHGRPEDRMTPAADALPDPPRRDRRHRDPPMSREGVGGFTLNSCTAIPDQSGSGGGTSARWRRGRGDRPDLRGFGDSGLANDDRYDVARRAVTRRWCTTSSATRRCATVSGRNSAASSRRISASVSRLRRVAVHLQHRAAVHREGLRGRQPSCRARRERWDRTMRQATDADGSRCRARHAGAPPRLHRRTSTDTASGRRWNVLAR